MIVKRESELLNEFNQYKKENRLDEKFDAVQFQNWFKIAYPKIKTVHYSDKKIEIK